MPGAGDPTASEPFVTVGDARALAPAASRRDPLPGMAAVGSAGGKEGREYDVSSSRVNGPEQMRNDPWTTRGERDGDREELRRSSPAE